MKIGILQPGYMPWLGFFDQIVKTDLFVLYDEVFYNRKSWRNRNCIKCANGKTLLSIPVIHEWGKKINEVRIDNSKNWNIKHLKSIDHNYKSSPFHNKYIGFFNNIFNEKWDRLVDINLAIIYYIIDNLGIKTKLILSSEAGFESKFEKIKCKVDSKTERIIMIMKELGAEEFYEGKAGKNYINEELLKKESLKVIYQNYQHPVYEQPYGAFIPYLSVIDLLFNHGEKSLDILSNK